MLGMLNIVRLVIQIVKSPIKTIKGHEIISYDKDAMLRVLSVASSVYFILTSLLRYEEIKFGLIVLFGIFGPVIMFLVYNITAVLYYITFKFLGKGIESNYDSIKIVLYPIFLTLMIINILTSLINHLLPATSVIFQYATNLWFYTMTFFLLRYKLRQTVVRSVLISLVPLFVGIAFGLVSIFNNL